MRNVKAQQYVRTNQFEIEARLDGLVEKFQVLDRDDIAEVLQSRRSELSRFRNKWTPEFLSLLLELSDRPAEKTQVEDLDGVQQPATISPELTWEEILADDPLTDEDLWKNVSFSPDSSEDEAHIPSTSARKRKQSPQKRHLHIEASSERPSGILPVEVALLDSVKQSQFWLRESEASESTITDSGRQVISEYQAISEVKHMLQSLPTSLFASVGQNIVVVGKFSITQVSPAEFDAVLKTFARTGSWLRQLKAYACQKTASPVSQTFRNAIRERFTGFYKELNGHEGFGTDSGVDVLISLQQLSVQIEELTRPLSWLYRTTSQLSSSQRPFDYLEITYSHTCNAQALGEERMFQGLAEIFFQCLRTYLKPLRLWMEEGELQDSDDGSFITKSTEDIELARLWHDLYSIRLDSNGRPLAPSFFHPSGISILNAGKSIVFLRRLGVNSSLESSAEEPNLDFESVCGDRDLWKLLPFPEMLASSLDRWIQSKCGLASSILRQYLFTECRLEHHLESLAYIYLSRDGALFQEFADQIFQRLDSAKLQWNDRFLLTELAQRVFASYIDSADISVKTGPMHRNTRSLKALSHIDIEVSLPWPILNIVQRSSLEIYRQVFRLLLQIYRAKYLLRLENAMIRHFGADKATVNLKQRLTWFADNMQTYILETVMTPALLRLREEISYSKEVDSLVNAHRRFILSIESQCLLTKNLKPIYDSLISLLNFAVQYSDFRARYLRSRDDGSILDDRSRRTRRKATELQEQKQEAEDHSDYSDEETQSTPETNDALYSNAKYEEQLAETNQQFSQLCNFAVAGLRGVSRAGGEVCWEMLSERLEWGLLPS